MEVMKIEQFEMCLQRFREEQELILNKVDNAIALFNPCHHLVLFNQKLALFWGLSPDWLQTQPHFDEIVDKLIARGYWSKHEQDQLKQALDRTQPDGMSMYLAQPNGICLHVDTTITNDGGRLLTFRDITESQKFHESLEAEIRRLRFLLGLTERLQATGDLREMAQFALNYLVKAMNSAFGDVKVISGQGPDRMAGPLTNQVSGEFIATYGEPAIAQMQTLLDRGIPYGQGFLWEVVETGQPKFIENYFKQPKAVEGFRHPGIGQLGIFPIPATTGRIIGVLTLESRSLQKLQEAPQQDMLLAACRMLGAAIERAQAQEHLQAINKDLERASQLKSEFLAAMSHELRTPLNSILGFSDLLQRQIGGTLSARQLNHVRAIEKSGEHLLQLINDILDLSKIEAGKADLYLERICIQELCTSCLKMIQPRADKKHLALSLEIDYRLSRLLLDERRVRQMAINLLSNAVKFTPERGHIKLSARLAFGKDVEQDNRPDLSPINPTTPYLCLEVKDTGIGIEPEKWHLLFRPFQQVDCALNRRHEGTGLGLALTKRLAELHGGTISFQSEPGIGSTFRVWLPITETVQSLEANGEDGYATSGEHPKAKLFDPKPNAKRILVVEDQPSNQVLIAEVLESEGYGVELISDGGTMLETIHSSLVSEHSLPDLVLMDIQLPEVDGLELIRHLKASALWQRVPVIAVTAMAMPGDRDRCMAAGANGYLSKPLNLEQMLATVECVIGLDR